MVSPPAEFQLTAARRRLPPNWRTSFSGIWFQLTAARRRLRNRHSGHGHGCAVSTHSRPKAAAQLGKPANTSKPGFNSQPPEGGCGARRMKAYWKYCFNSQPPEGGCFWQSNNQKYQKVFQLTAARRRLHDLKLSGIDDFVFQLTAARRRLLTRMTRCDKGSKFQLTAARRRLRSHLPKQNMRRRFQLTAARRRLPKLLASVNGDKQFQLTAARRRLR